MNPKPEPSERGVKFAEWFRTLLPASARVVPAWREKWARLFDDLIRLDARTPEEVAAVCRWARAHDFWAQNFQSPEKLRKRDRDGVMYFDRFLAGMNPAAARRAVQATKEYTVPRKPGVIE